MSKWRNVALVAITFIGVLASVSACRSSKEPGKVTSKPSRPPIADVLARHSPALMAIEGVVGTYEGRTDDGEPCIKIMIVEDTAELRRTLPDMLEGYPVLLRATGEIGPVDGSESGK